MNTRCCVVEFAIRTIIVTKTFLKKASTPFTEEYRMLTKLMEQHPDFRIEVKRSSPRRRFMPSYSTMLNFIQWQDNAEELMVEFDSIRHVSQMERNPYMVVRNWFVEKFHGELNTEVMAA